MYCIEKSTCEIVGTFRHPGNFPLLVPPHYAPAHLSKTSRRQRSYASSSKNNIVLQEQAVSYQNHL